MPRPDRLSRAADVLAPPDTGDILVLRATSPALAEAFGRDRVLHEQSFRPVHDMLAGQGLRVTPVATGAFSMVVVQLTRARAENFGNVARGLAALPPGGLLAIDGARTDGIDSLARALAAHLPLEGVEAKAHGRLVWLRRPADLPAIVADWAAAAEPSRNAAGFLTCPGLFSPDAPDPGSRQLAEHLDPKMPGRVADLGAGWGWLAVQALARCPRIQHLDLIEAEARALDMARANISDPRAAFHWTDATRLMRGPDLYDTVLSNPPFHQGRAAEPDLGTAFIASAARILKPGGRFLMVANRQLPYEAALDAAFTHWERLSEDGAYKVIAADRPRRR